jgi:hypothetical protein
MDLETTWPGAHPVFFDEGHAYVALSAQLVGVSELRAWDPVRYGTLTHPGDSPHSFRILEQAVQAIRSPTGVSPLGGLRATHVIVSGDSQSASRITSYITGGYAIAGHIDGFYIGRGGGNQATANYAKANRVAMMNILEESQGTRPADNPYWVVWHGAGQAHAPIDWHSYIWRANQRDLFQGAPVPNAVTAACSTNRGEAQWMARAAHHWLNKWVRGQGAPPSAPKLERDAEGELIRDADGHAKGGLRYPVVAVPIAHNTSEGCPLFGTYEPWPSDQIIARYPTRAAYVGKIQASVKALVTQKFLRPVDGVEIVDRAKSFDVWSPGAAMCHDVNAPLDRAGLPVDPCPPAVP